MINRERSIINLAEKAKKILIALLSLFFIVEFVFSQSWRIYIDTPIFHYAAFLIDRYHAVPYKDFFDMNMPITYMIHLGIGKLFGYGDLALKLIDSVLLLLLMFMMWKLMSRFGRYASLTSATLFGIVFLSYGPYMIMQRDYLGIFPIMISVLIAVDNIKIKRKWLKVLSIGMLFGLSAAIKPHLMIGLPVLLLYINWRSPDNEYESLLPFTKRILKDHVIALMAAALVFCIPLLWLWYKGGLSAFIDIVINFFPLYAQVSPTHQPITGIEKLVIIDLAIQGLGSKGGLLVVSVLAVYLFLSEAEKKEDRAIIYLLSSLLILYFLYPIVSAKFYPYHWMPYYFFLSLLSGLIFYDYSPKQKTNIRILFPLVVLIFGIVTSLNPAKEFISQLVGQNATSLQYEKIDHMANYLKKHLHEGDKVQPRGSLVSGSQQAMLLAEANLATPFPMDRLIYDFDANDYIKRIRREYISKMIEVKPRFILETEEYNNKGPDTRPHFEELTEFITNNYRVVEKGKGYNIYELLKEHN